MIYFIPINIKETEREKERAGENEWEKQKHNKFYAINFNFTLARRNDNQPKLFRVTIFPLYIDLPSITAANARTYTSEYAYITQVQSYLYAKTVDVSIKSKREIKKKK